MTLIRLPRIILALALALALAACSTIKLGYATLPDLAYWWLDGYVDFDETQAPRVRQELAQLHAWHRQQELPRLVELLGRLQQMAPERIAAPSACAVVSEVQLRLNAVAERAEPAVLALATSLAPRQLRHLERKYRRNNERYIRDWIAPGPAAARDKRYEDQLERLESVYGRLDEPQRAVLRQALAQSIHDPQRILDERRRRQQDLLLVLHTVQQPGASPDAARAQLRGYLERVQRSPDPGYRAWQDQLLQESCGVFAAVHESTTPAQRQQAVRRLRAYERDLRDLAGQP